MTAAAQGVRLEAASRGQHTAAARWVGQWPPMMVRGGDEDDGPTTGGRPREMTAHVTFLRPNAYELGLRGFHEKAHLQSFLRRATNQPKIVFKKTKCNLTCSPMVGRSSGTQPTRVQILVLASFLESFRIYRRYALSGKRRSRRRRGAIGDFGNLQICRWWIYRRYATYS
jgi:hypothetical protein